MLISSGVKIPTKVDLSSVVTELRITLLFSITISIGVTMQLLAWIFSVSRLTTIVTRQVILVKLTT
ncbi:hypothetical protein F383_09075 [Gossypium arboreum]|uniref:Uncharacterized protein n=1 Tax=Gossypium arboreum TaxID=29729 RepID=A0A0B0NW83_GOSAR|nr:hypothetical protein F383_09075 [Gossypium arboreum]